MGYIELILLYLKDILYFFKDVITFLGSLLASVVTIYLGYLTLTKSVRFIGYCSYNSVWNGSSYSITLFNNSLSAVCINKILFLNCNMKLNSIQIYNFINFFKKDIQGCSII